MHHVHAPSQLLGLRPVSPSNQSVLYGDTDGFTLEGEIDPTLIDLVVVECEWTHYDARASTVH